MRVNAHIRAAHRGYRQAGAGMALLAIPTCGHGPAGDGAALAPSGFSDRTGAGNPGADRVQWWLVKCWQGCSLCGNASVRPVLGSAQLELVAHETWTVRPFQILTDYSTAASRVARRCAR